MCTESITVSKGNGCSQPIFMTSTLMSRWFVMCTLANILLFRHRDRHGSFSRRSEPEDANKDHQPHRHYPKHRYGRTSVWDEDREDEERRWKNYGQRRRPPSRGSIHSAFEYGNEYRYYGEPKQRDYRAGSRGAASDRYEDEHGGGKEFNGDMYEDDDDYSSGTGRNLQIHSCFVIFIRQTFTLRFGLIFMVKAWYEY